MKDQASGVPATLGTTGRGIAIAVAAAGVFSTVDAFVKLGNTGYPVFEVTLIVALFALLATVGIVAATEGLPAVVPRSPVIVGIRGLLFVATMICAYTAFRLLPLTEAYTILFTAPFQVTVFSVVLFRERVGWKRWTAVFAGFLGVIVMLRPGLRDLGFGHLAAGAFAFAYACSVMIIRHCVKETNGALLAPAFAVEILVLSCLVVGLDAWVTPNLRDFLLLATAGLGYGCAHMLLIHAFRRAPVAVVAPFQYTQMVWAVAYGAILWGRWPDAAESAGAAIVCGTGLFIAIAENSPRRGPVRS